MGDLHYAHANQRLRTRYGFEISKEEWRAVGRKFQLGKVSGARKTYNGDYEGWVTINDVDVCAYYSMHHKCVSTFFALPPPKPGYPKEDIPLLIEQVKQAHEFLAEAKTKAAAIVAEAERQAKNFHQSAVVVGSLDPDIVRRRSGPNLSVAESNRIRILTAFIAAGEDGLTADQVQIKLGLTHQACSPRVSELANKHYTIISSGRTRPTRTGRDATVYIHASVGFPVDLSDVEAQLANVSGGINA